MITDYLDELKKGNTKALKYFIEKYEVKLTYFCSKKISDSIIADEIVCDTFHKLWMNREKIISLPHLENFLFKVTKNACINTALRDSHCQNITLDVKEHDFSDDYDIHNEIVMAEFMEILYAEIDKLPPQQATVFKLSFLEGLDNKDICSRLHTSQNTVSNAKSIAVKTLRDIFRKKGIKMSTLFLVLIYSKL